MPRTRSELEHPGVRDFVRAHEAQLEDALKVYTSEDTWTFALSRLIEHFGGQFSGYKDDFGRFRCDTIKAFMQGHDVPDEDLRCAIFDLMASFNESAEAVYRLKQQQIKKQIQRPGNPPRWRHMPVR